MLKKVLLFVLLVCSLPLAAQQLYYVTENQIQQLEALCQTYKDSRQKQLAQLKELQTRVADLQTDCTSLSEMLALERKTTAALSHSLGEYEDKNSALAQAYQQEQQTVAQLRSKAQKLFTGLIIAVIVIVVFIIAFVLCVIIKLKL